ncbi:MAG TPA: GNAT family N-acetyltransferase [Devosiaceae bacterium]|jgi:hypothetical protein|nr:GNAT family N-acetyltransferase [Devosiaceae bacterium]
MAATAQVLAEPGAAVAAAAVPVTARVVLLRAASDSAWEEAVAGFDGVCQEQLLTFARTRWPGLRHEPVLFEYGGQLIGGCLVMIQPLPLGVGAIAVVKWGPMLADAGRPDALALYGGMVEALVEEFARQRRLMVSILPHAAIGGNNDEFAQLLQRGFRPGARLRYPERYIVNLRLSDEEQRRSFEQKWRYHLNKSEKAGLSFEHGDSERLPEFDALYELMVDRKRFPDHSAYETVPALMALSDDRLRPELFFVRHDGEIIAGAIIFKAGNRAVYLYGATSDRALPLRAGYFLHWHIIRWLRDNTRADWYDLGGTDGFQGLHQFKKGMVGSAGVIRPVPPVGNYAAYPLPFLLGEGAFAAREFLKSVGHVLDRLRADRASPDQRRHRGSPAGAP